MQPKQILIVDDEESVRESLDKVLTRAGYVTHSAGSGEDALALMTKKAVDLVLTDLRMPESDGLSLLKQIKKGYPDTEVILLTGYGTIEIAVEAIKEGAYDFITKPPKKAVILSTVERAFERQNLAQENKYLKAQLGKAAVFEDIIGKSPAMASVLQMVERVAPLISTVLIAGESGTGKELIARAIHRNGPRANNRFIPVNSAAIPENLIESELFGHMKGAFTGAMRDKHGLFKVAEGGTLFLDEISSVPLNLQAKLLRAIEQKEILPVGSTSPEIIDVRIIAATNKDLAAEAERGNFREDLYYRLNVVGINLPPLRERREDIASLVSHFIKIYNVQLNKRVREVETATMEALKNLEWKGNVRELENIIERAMIMCDGEVLQFDHFSPLLAQKPATTELEEGLKGSVRKFERETILKALQQTAQDKSKAAGILNMSLSTLYRKMAELGIPNKE